MYSFSFVVLLSNASAALPNKAFQHVDTRNYKVRVCVNGCGSNVKTLPGACPKIAFHVAQLAHDKLSIQRNELQNYNPRLLGLIKDVL